MKRHLTAAALSVAAALVSLWLLGTGGWSVALAAVNAPLTYAWWIQAHPRAIERSGPDA